MQKFEDTELDLNPLPMPKLVSTPDGVPNELFGDVAMITQFISTYRGLLMPDSKESFVRTLKTGRCLCNIEYSCFHHVFFFSDDLLNSLVGGQQNFQQIARNLMVLLQTLLQDELAEVCIPSFFSFVNYDVHSFAGLL